MFVMIFRAYYIQQKQHKTLSPVDQHFLQRVIDFGKQNGLHLSKLLQNKIKVPTIVAVLSAAHFSLVQIYFIGSSNKKLHLISIKLYFFGAIMCVI